MAIKINIPTGDILCREPTETECAEFRRAAKVLDRLGKKGFHIYLANDTLHLMIGPSHDKHQCDAQERIRESVFICQSSGGDW